MFNGINATTGQIDPTLPLAADRFVPIEPAPDYMEGSVSINGSGSGLSVPYPGPGGGSYPFYTPGSDVLLIEECVYQPDPNPSLLIPNPPTSWFWNIRIGDRLQVNRSGPWFTVVGPMTVTPATGNSEMFVNVGPPGPLNRQTSPLIRVYNGTLYYPEFLLLVNGQDDNNNGWVDEGWDGFDNNGDGNIDELAEWETELWPATFVAQSTQNYPYRIRRRPAPITGGRITALPTHVVVDLLTWQSTRAVPAPGQSLHGFRRGPRQPERRRRAVHDLRDAHVLRARQRLLPFLARGTERRLQPVGRHHRPPPAAPQGRRPHPL